MKLIIAEKPSVAKSIASALGASSRADGFYEGNNLIVSWCVGHLVSPLDAGGYDERFKKWHYEDLPILPEPFRYVLAPGKEDAFENLRVLMDRPDVDTIVNACDAGREGELIFRLVYEMTGCRKPVLRLWISSMEDSAIREGFSDLRPGADYESLYQSALCRQKADWLVGINATRLFSVLYHRTLNVGRVQTPTLAMLAERDAKITLFHKEKYHLLRLTLDGVEAVSEKFTDPAKAEQAAAMCKGAAVTCTSVTKEQKKEQPPKLYDLTTLQREANRLFGYTAKQTLDYAQSLYEKKLLTYPRTDSRYLTSDMVETASCVIHLAAKLPPFDGCTNFFPLVEAMTALPDKKENIYRNQLMKPFEFKWACVGIPLTAAQEGGYDVVSAATMSGFYAPVQITEERQAEIEKISSDTFWASCEASIRNTLLDFEQHGIQLPKQEYVFTVMLSDPQSPMTAMTGDYCGDGGIPGYIIGSIVPNERSLGLLPVALAHETNHNVRWQFMQWSNHITLADMIVSEGLAETFAAKMFGEDKVGKWVSETIPEVLRKTIKPLVRENLEAHDFQTLSSYLYGDEIMSLRGGQPIGMPYCGGYACGYALIGHYLKKTGASIYEATITPTEEILKQSEDFWK